MSEGQRSPGLDGLRIWVREDASATDRLNAERSVAALVQRAQAAFEARRTLEAEADGLGEALRGPLLRLVQDDARAAGALEALRSRPLAAIEPLDALARETPPATCPGAPTGPSGAVTNRSLDLTPPYDFSWSWHAGEPAFEQVLTRPSGRVGLDARSGHVAGGASGFVNAHAGFGVFLSADTEGQRFPHAVLNPGRFQFAVGTNGVGSNATSEGGFELTVFEDGQPLVDASRKLWRSRVSGTLFDPTESASGSLGPQAFTGPELAFTIRPGHGYTFNAGIWVYADHSSGIGVAGGQSLLEGNISRMWVFG